MIKVGRSRNLSVIVDQALCFNYHIKSARTIVCPFKNMSNKINVLVISRLDYCNSILSGCPNYSLRTVQSIQHAAAHVQTGTGRRQRKPVLATLNWLSANSKIELKILLIID